MKINPWQFKNCERCCNLWGTPSGKCCFSRFWPGWSFLYLAVLSREGGNQLSEADFIMWICSRIPGYQRTSQLQCCQSSFGRIWVLLTFWKKGLQGEKLSCDSEWEAKCASQKSVVYGKNQMSWKIGKKNKTHKLWHKMK